MHFARNFCEQLRSHPRRGQGRLAVRQSQPAPADRVRVSMNPSPWPRAWRWRSQLHRSMPHGDAKRSLHPAGALRGGGRPGAGAPHRTRHAQAPSGWARREREKRDLGVSLTCVAVRALPARLRRRDAAPPGACHSFLQLTGGARASAEGCVDKVGGSTAARGAGRKRNTGKGYDLGLAP